MTPVDFLKQYHHLTVEFVNPALSSADELVFDIAEIKVRTYVSTVGNPCPDEVKGVLQTDAELQVCMETKKKAMKKHARAKERLAEKDQALPKDLADDRQAVNRAFNGKGSPADIALALAWAVEKGRCEPNQTAIQQYCDTWLGMDCNGLTDRYFKKAETWEPHRYLSGGIQRAELSEIQMDDVLVWCSASGKPHSVPPDRHVALVQGVQLMGVSHLGGQRGLVRPKKGKSGLKMKEDLSHEFGKFEWEWVNFSGFNVGPRLHVVESTGGLGPVESFYPVIDRWEHGDGKNIVFRVRRLHKGGSSFVRIAKPTIPTP